MSSGSSNIIITRVRLNWKSHSAATSMCWFCTWLASPWHICCLNFFFVTSIHFCFDFWKIFSSLSHNWPWWILCAISGHWSWQGDRCPRSGSWQRSCSWPEISGSVCISIELVALMITFWMFGALVLFWANLHYLIKHFLTHLMNVVSFGCFCRVFSVEVLCLPSPSVSVLMSFVANKVCMLFWADSMMLYSFLSLLGSCLRRFLWWHCGIVNFLHFSIWLLCWSQCGSPTQFG